MHLGIEVMWWWQDTLSEKWARTREEAVTQIERRGEVRDWVGSHSLRGKACERRITWNTRKEEKRANAGRCEEMGRATWRSVKKFRLVCTGTESTQHRNQQPHIRKQEDEELTWCLFLWAHSHSCSVYLVVEPLAGSLWQGHCRARRLQSIPHPGECSWAGHSQGEAGCTAWPLECAGLHSSSVHP